MVAVRGKTLGVVYERRADVDKTQLGWRQFLSLDHLLNQPLKPLPDRLAIQRLTSLVNAASGAMSASGVMSVSGVMWAMWAMWAAEGAMSL